MAAEIVILSGSRRGQQFTTDMKTFRVGDAPDCEVSFAADLDPGAQAKIVSFYLQDDGWRARSLGTPGVVINGEPLQGEARVRSGDIVKLSHQGPDLCFKIVTATAIANRSLPPRDVASPIQQTRQSAAAPATEPDANVSARQEHPVFGRVGMVSAPIAAAIVIGIGWLLVSNHRSSDSSTSESTSSTVAPAATQSLDEATRNARDERSQEANATTAARRANPWSKGFDSVRKATLLLVAENIAKQKTWSVTSACAVSDNMLLTSASTATELASFSTPEWKLWATSDLTGTRLPVKSIRVHVGYVKSADAPAERIYFDLALVEVAGKLPAVAALAGDGELDELDSGYALGCVSIPHETGIINRFQSLQPELVPCKVLVTTSLDPPSGPRLLHVKGDFPAKPYGGFFINHDGKIVAEFAETGTADENGLIVHYAPIVNHELIQIGIDGQSELWVAPQPTEETSKQP